MTNKQILPQGICILKEELINPNESLIGRIVRGMFLSTGTFSCVFKVSGYPFTGLYFYFHPVYVRIFSRSVRHNVADLGS